MADIPVGQDQAAVAQDHVPPVPFAPAAGAPPVNPVHDVLTVCGVGTQSARDTFIDVEGLDTLDAFATLNGDSDVTEMAKRMASRTAAVGRVILGTMQIKRIQALVYWVKDHHKRDLDVTADMWTPAVMMATLQRKEAELNFEKVDVDLIDPGKCQTDAGWDAWQIAFVNKLSATMGAAKVPVVYVIRDVVDDDYEFEDDEERRIHQMPLAGENFKRDNRLVYGMLKASCVKSDAWAWIQDHDKSADGRKAWRSLVSHYDGTGELSKRVERAKEEISRLHYKDEKVYPFERYVTKLEENFFILSKDKDENLTERQRVHILTTGIRSTDPSIVAAKTDVYKDFRTDFSAATNFLSGLISNIHAGAQLDYSARNTGKRRYVSAVGSHDGRGSRARARRGGGRYGQQSGRGGRGGRDGRGRGRGLKTYINNVDCTDIHRNFTSDEWERLGNMRSYVLQARESGRGGRGSRAPGRGQEQGQRNASATSTTTATAATADNAEQSVVSEITERGSQNGRGFGRGAYS
jgi:hypothetical protein